MPAIQTTYPTGLSPAFEGMLATSEPFHAITKIVETAAGIGMGKAVVRGTADNQVQVSAASKLFLGISIFGQAIRPEINTDKYGQYENIPVLLKGVIWVTALVDVADGDLAYVVPASGGFTNTSNSSANYTVPGGVFETTGLAGTLVKLRINA